MKFKQTKLKQYLPVDGIYIKNSYFTSGTSTNIVIKSNNKFFVCLNYCYGSLEKARKCEKFINFILIINQPRALKI